MCRLSRSTMPVKTAVERLTPARVTRAVTHLSSDPLIGPIIARYPKPRYEMASDVFGALTRAIVSQQLSTKAAATIYSRVLALIKKDYPCARSICKCSPEKLREAGLS